MRLKRIIAAGQVIPLMFSQNAVAASQSAVAMKILEGSGGTNEPTEYQIPWDFDVVAISMVADTARTAGSCTVDATIDGTVTGVQAVLDATNTLRHYSTQRRDTDTGSAGSRVGVKLTTPAGWTPVTADLNVVVWVLVRATDI